MSTTVNPLDATTTQTNRSISGQNAAQTLAQLRALVQQAAGTGVAGSTLGLVANNVSAAVQNLNGTITALQEQIAQAPSPALTQALTQAQQSLGQLKTGVNQLNSALNTAGSGSRIGLTATGAQVNNVTTGDVGAAAGKAQASQSSPLDTPPNEAAGAAGTSSAGNFDPNVLAQSPGLQVLAQALQQVIGKVLSGQIDANGKPIGAGASGTSGAGATSQSTGASGGSSPQTSAQNTNSGGSPGISGSQSSAGTGAGTSASSSTGAAAGASISQRQFQEAFQNGLFDALFAAIKNVKANQAQNTNTAAGTQGAKQQAQANSKGAQGASAGGGNNAAASTPSDGGANNGVNSAAGTGGTSPPDALNDGSGLTPIGGGTSQNLGNNVGSPAAQTTGSNNGNTANQTTNSGNAANQTTNSGNAANQATNPGSATNQATLPGGLTNQGNGGLPIDVPFAPTTQLDTGTFSPDPLLSYPNINGLVQAILLASYDSANKDLKAFAGALQKTIAKKNELRNQINAKTSANTQATDPELQRLNNELQQAGDDANLQQLTLQSATQAQGQALQALTNFLKNTNDEASNIIRHIGGG